MLKVAVSIVGLVCLAALACSAADLKTAEKERLAKDSILVAEMAQKYLDPANPLNKSSDPHYWTIAGMIIRSIDAMRQNIIGYAFEYPESELKYAFASCETLGNHALAALNDIVGMGDMKSTSLSKDIAELEKLIRRKPGQP